jgi:hypothetical protein
MLRFSPVMGPGEGMDSHGVNDELDRLRGVASITSPLSALLIEEERQSVPSLTKDKELVVVVVVVVEVVSIVMGAAAYVVVVESVGSSKCTSESMRVYNKFILSLKCFKYLECNSWKKVKYDSNRRTFTRIKLMSYSMVDTKLLMFKPRFWLRK